MIPSSPDITALAQTVQPTVPVFQVIEGYQDIQTVVAVLESQQSFVLDQNTARYKGKDGALTLPDEAEKIRYLGYILTKQIQLQRPLKIQLTFNSYYAGTPLILMLRSFGLQGKNKIRLTQGLSFHQDAVVNQAGTVTFEFDAFDEWIRYPDRVTGFLVYLIRLPGQKIQILDTQEQEAEIEAGIMRSALGLNVYRRIDTRA
jgi:hypothetical protein